MPKKILIVEDELALQETLSYNLEREGYKVKVEGDGAKALKIAGEMKPDLILMDIMLPGIDGIEITRLLRHKMNVPIIMLTARDDEIDRVIGLEIGADDYITKPFSMRELLARVKAHLRRVRLIRAEVNAQEKPAVKKLIYGNLSINLARSEAAINEEIMTLKPKEYDLLQYLMEHQGHALSRDHILEQVWGWDFSGGSRTVDVHIRWLREKIEPDATTPNRIITVRGVGYRFEG
ncbi:MAG: response regulator transcription factor [Chloroflexota bacterium]|nr:response regulator transcription factor [Chloroflexota bacterium]